MSLVSVIVPAYNQSQYLGDAIRSVLGQTDPDVEVIVVDDGSTDDTREVAHGFADSRVRYVYQENRGLSAARNTGIAHARGTFLSFLDSDDGFLPEKIASLRAVFDDDPRLGLVSGQAVLIDENSQPLGEVFERGLPEETSDLLLGNPLHVGSVLLRKAWQERVGAFDETLRSYEDWDMWLRLAKAGCPMASVRRPVSLYRFHRAQMTRLGRQMTTATFAVLEKTFNEADLPASWRARRSEAYSRANLRAAAQAYTARDYARAQEYMREAIHLAPELCSDEAEPVARLAAGWANHVKTDEPLAFLAGIYSHLPDELAAMRARRRRDLARQALHLAFAAHDRGDAQAARRRLWQAIGYRPVSVLDRGVVSLFVRTLSASSGGG